MDDQKDSKHEDIPARLPKNVASDILNWIAERWELPLLEGIAENPIFFPDDGHILAKPGYDPRSRLYYAGLPLPDIPDNPTQQQAIAAAKYLDEHLLADFPCADDASHANLFGANLSPFIRPCVELVPMCAVTAPSQDSGKTISVHLVSILSTGFHAAVSALPQNDEEMNKTLISILRENPASSVVFDNCEGCVGQPSLDIVLTSLRYKGRLLGSNSDYETTHALTIYVTGNNIFVTGDMARRTYWIKLRPDSSQTRKFKHEQIDQWVKDNRNELLKTVFIMFRAWFVAGKPKPKNVPRISNYQVWAELIGGVLEHAGVQGFLSTFHRDAAAAAKEQSAWTAFLVQLFRIHRTCTPDGNLAEFYTREFRVREVIEGLRDKDNRDYYDARETIPAEIAVLLGDPHMAVSLAGKHFATQCDHIYPVIEQIGEGDTAEFLTVEYKLFLSSQADRICRYRVLRRIMTVNPRPWPFADLKKEN